MTVEQITEAIETGGLVVMSNATNELYCVKQHTNGYLLMQNVYQEDKNFRITAENIAVAIKNGVLTFCWTIAESKNWK